VVKQNLVLLFSQFSFIGCAKLIFLLTFFSMPKESNKEKASEKTTVSVFRHLHIANSRSKKQKTVRTFSVSPRTYQLYQL
jgi:hypothetical protein